MSTIDELTTAGQTIPLSKSRTNLDLIAHKYGRPYLSNDLKITLTFHDGSEPVSFVRTPREGPITISGELIAILTFNLDVDFDGDGRDISSIEIQAASEGFSPAESFSFRNVGRFIEADAATPGAEYSVDGGLSWQPILGDDGRRYQLTLCITP